MDKTSFDLSALTDPGLMGAQSLALFFICLYLCLRLRPLLASAMPADVRVSALLFGGAFLLSFFALTFALNLGNWFFALELSFLIGLSVLDPSFAFAIFLALLILRPWELWPDNAALLVLPRASFFVLAISFLVDGLRQGVVSISLNKAQLLVLALAVWIFLSTFQAPDMAEQQHLFIEVFLKSVIICILVFQVVTNRDRFETITTVFFIAILGLAMTAIINSAQRPDLLSLGSDLASQRLEGKGMFGNANDLAAIMILAIPFGFRGVFRKDFSLPSILTATLVTAIGGYGIWQARSRAAFLALVAMAAIYVIFKDDNVKESAHGGKREKWPGRRWPLLFCLLGIGVIIALQLRLGRNSSDLDESQANRLGYWSAGVAMALRHPVLGVGYNQFPRNYQLYGSAEFSEVGERTAHSSWILLLAEAGFPALLLLAGLYIAALRRAWTFMATAPEMFLALIGYGVVMSFLSHTYTPYPYLLVGLALSYPAFSATELAKNRIRLLLRTQPFWRAREIKA